jgi:membrane associated rhomboid family serine protease
MQTCYRHPGRETGVACSNCGRPICPDCMTTTQVGMRCPECARERTAVHTVRAAGSAPVLTYALISVCVLAYVGGALGGGGLLSGDLGGSSITRLGALFGPLVADGEIWRLVTSGFLHAGVIHLAFNMFALWILGTILEPAIGTLRFGVLFFVGLLSGSFGALLLNPDAPTVGASGAVFGLMGAALIVMRRRGMNVMESGLGLWLGLNLLITFTLPGISIGGHLGGLAGGTLAALLMFELGDRVPVPKALATVLGAVVGAVAVAASLAIA